MHSKPLVLLGMALLVGALTVAFFSGLLNRGSNLPASGYEFGLGAAAVTGFTGWLGWHVHRFKERKPTWMSAVGAARVAALSLALSHVGAISAGYFGGQILFLLLDFGNESLLALLGTKIAGLIGASLMVAGGIAVEKICTIDPKDPPPQNAAAATA
ncbi:MAG: DUF3180 domain-containing protein [Mobiluncus sp.]|uniref:DUF3180 domain-containing protein n=1 Tax=Mobiluncus sp. TaxID=47293 RepID=UPI00258FD5C6|nr:DUF3180 domain-containing protein [Mobiluncus sp.]MCI6583481.1 DUF3180 domain-containing protein [Mobiluncus sp.]